MNVATLAPLFFGIGIVLAVTLLTVSAGILLSLKLHLRVEGPGWRHGLSASVLYAIACVGLLSSAVVPGLYQRNEVTLTGCWIMGVGDAIALVATIILLVIIAFSWRDLMLPPGEDEMIKYRIRLFFTLPVATSCLWLAIVVVVKWIHA